jgi:transglutaminase-like putative cysteine protease
MNARAREIELLLVTALSALPLYFTQAVELGPLLIFHLALAGMIYRVARSKSPEIIPEPVLRVIAIAYVPLYIVDAMANHAIAASTHLVLFIAVYQPIESMRRNNRAQRLLTAALIFVASVATSTDITIVLFVIGFGFLMFRQLMLLSHIETAASIGHEYDDAPSNRTAAFYLVGSTVLAALLFPIIPRTRNPLVQGVSGALTNATTGLSTTIDFSQQRASTPDPSVVSRVWMGPDALPFFTPLRLRANVYDRYIGHVWLQSSRGYRDIAARDGVFEIARPVGFKRTARVQQRFVRNGRLYLPTGTYAINGLIAVSEGPSPDTFTTATAGRQSAAFDIAMARGVMPLRNERPRVLDYPVTPAVAALAHQIVRNDTDTESQSRKIETYMTTHFRYYMRPVQRAKPPTIDEFLLKDRRGHCEYFAAGMVVLMSALGKPARVVGGFYGGKLNPLTGYFAMRLEDAHAWVEVWTGDRWLTFDPTPPAMRPGNVREGLLRTYLSALNDSVNFFWDRYVLTYGLGDQVAFAMEVLMRLRNTLGRSHASLSMFRQKFTFVDATNVVAVLAALAALVLFIRRRRRPLFDDLSGHLRFLGIDVGPAMTMEEALRIVRDRHPDAARDLAPLIAEYEDEMFSPRRVRGRAAAIRRALAKLRTAST